MKKYMGLFSWVMGIVGTIIGIVGIVQLFEDQSTLFKICIVVVTFLCIAILAAIFFAFSEVRDSKRQNGFIGDKSMVVQANKRYLSSLYNSGEYNDVCNYGSVFSRVFYIAGAYQSRYQIGIMVFMSADKLNRDKLCATTLIDLGWPSLLLGVQGTESFTYKGVKYTCAKDFLLQSIKYSRKIGDNGLISKAYRHLSGYYLSEGNFPEAKKYRAKSEDYLNKLPDGMEKSVYIANLVYADAETAFLEHNYTLSKELCIKADELKRGVDEEVREIRYYSQRGKIEYVQKRYSDAKGFFMIGLESAKKLNRIDEITKNTYGYASCLILEGQRHEAEQYVKRMLKKYGDLPLFIADQYYKKEYHRLLSLNSLFETGGDNDA